MSEEDYTIEEKIAEGRGEFIIVKDGEPLGGIYFHFVDDSHISIQHTEVNKKLRGTGAARKLVHKAVEYARSHKLKLSSECSYAGAVLAKNRDDFKDVLAR